MSLHDVWMNGGFLGIRCLHCGHRTMLHKSRRPTIRDGNMTRLHTLKLKCACCGSVGRGKDHWEMCTPFNDDEADRFLWGDDIGRPVELLR
jgi:hypothetical protein